MKIISKFTRTAKHNFCPHPIIEGQYGVLPPRFVPKEIPRPSYVDNPNPTFGIYEGKPVKHDQQTIRRLHQAGQLVARTLDHTRKLVMEGMTTDDVDKIVHDFIIDNNAYPSPIQFLGFPKSVCTSVNEVVCHGIPNLRPLRNGDYLNIDCTLFLDGVHGDSSIMVQVGDVHPKIQDLIKATQEAVYESISICKPGTPFKQIGTVCEKVAEKYGFVVCELFTGHGIGELMHLPPSILHHYNDYSGEMQVGNVFTIEPIFLMRHGEFQMWRDGFTVVSPQNPSAQWEHMVQITENGYNILSKREGESI